MADTDDVGDGGAAAGEVGRVAGGASGVLPRKVRASAPAVVPEPAGQAVRSRSGAGVRLTGHSQHHPVGGGRRRVRVRLGEPDGALWSHLTPRDRQVLDLVAEHQVLTTWQLLALVFPSEARAQRRLRELAELGVLFRTQPHRAAGGSKPFHYLLGYRGAELLTAQRGAASPRPAAHLQKITRILESPTLRHLLGVNQFFADLSGYTRGLGAGRAGLPEGEGLRVWHSEAWVREYYRPHVRPDGYGLWSQHERSLGFFLEHDTGAESLLAVADKLEDYTGKHHDTARALTAMVLFWVASRRREQGLRKALWAKHSPVPVATASRDHGDPDGPAGEVWSVVAAEPDRVRRVRIDELPMMIGGTEPDGTPSVLTRLPPPTDDEVDTEGYWTAYDDDADADDPEPATDTGTAPRSAATMPATPSEWLRSRRSA